MSAECKELHERLAVIDTLDRNGCLNRWREMFGRPPPKYLSPQFMRRVLIYETQARALGGLSQSIEQRLKKASLRASATPRAKAGTRLVREWNGRTYQVEVVDGGYVMDGKSWRSLSAIARHITGARWSGPRFFGVQ
ncbi:MAG: DUF2924 domain-containing protein [Litoreibacter sp.]|nr:DUF2924 domain-containing protein [Litoreibacter sp.]MCY4333400.1 DUF2924 domain-containing protein [Litoreibacter sp.]